MDLPRTLVYLAAFGVASALVAQPPVPAAISADSTSQNHQVRVLEYRFDPLIDGEPELSPDEMGPSSGLRLRLVQLQGPTLNGWYSSLEASGARILQYYPHHSYLVWADASAAERVAGLPFVRWVGLFHPAYKLSPGLAQHTGQIENIAGLVYDDGGLVSVLGDLSSEGATNPRVSRASTDGGISLVEFSANASNLRAMSRLDRVIWLGYQSPTRYSDDEMSDQISAGNHVAGIPFVGYQSHLSSLGFDGTGVIWAISDTGVDWDHPDLSSRLIGGFSPPGSSCDFPGQPGSDCAGGGHGTHVAGITGGDATGGFTDTDGFLYGLGVAPGVSLWALNVFSDISLEDAVKVALLGGAVGSNNSWASGPAGAGYTASARLEDILVRDGNLETTDVAEPFIQVFSAGNSGPGASTITEPKEAKNLISVANSLNFRAGDIDDLRSSSSRGPALDGRMLPVVTAPGTTISSTRNDLGGSCSTSIPNTDNLYAFCTGTSMAAPNVAGAVALAVEWWRDTQAGADPSMAMAKALMINGAVDMGAADIPNNNEGWGRINLTGVLNPEASTFYLDQAEILANSTEQWNKTFLLADPGQPLRVTLVYSDAPGAAGASPALVNNLDLQVDNGGQSFLGNVFSSGWSATGGSADVLNNVENVYLQSPSIGDVAVTITATNIAGDGVPYNGDATDQDFALVCCNCLAEDIFFDGFESGDTDAWSNTLP